ncbi:hypothetical protein ACTXT7_006882 [Hymenolepis weldensis]
MCILIASHCLSLCVLVLISGPPPRYLNVSLAAFGYTCCNRKWVSAQTLEHGRTPVGGAREPNPISEGATTTTASAFLGATLTPQRRKSNSPAPVSRNRPGQLPLHLDFHNSCNGPDARTELDLNVEGDILICGVSTIVYIKLINWALEVLVDHSGSSANRITVSAQISLKWGFAPLEMGALVMKVRSYLRIPRRLSRIALAFSSSWYLMIQKKLSEQSTELALHMSWLCWGAIFLEFHNREGKTISLRNGKVFDAYQAKWLSLLFWFDVFLSYRTGICRAVRRAASSTPRVSGLASPISQNGDNTTCINNNNSCSGVTIRVKHHGKWIHNSLIYGMEVLVICKVTSIKQSILLLNIAVGYSTTRCVSMVLEPLASLVSDTIHDYGLVSTAVDSALHIVEACPMTSRMSIGGGEINVYICQVRGREIDASGDVDSQPH